MDSQLTSLVSAIRRWPQAAGADRPALVSGSRQISYRDLAHQVGGLSGSLHAMGIGPGERVALAMDRSIELVVTLLAVLASGACACILEPKLGAQECQRRFAMTRMGWLISDAAHAGDPSLSGLDGVNPLSFDRLGASEPFWVPDPDPMAASLLLFTSGSSGKPKGVLQSHRGLLVNAMGVATHTGLDPGHRLLHVMPLHHTNGVNNQIIAPLLAGATVVLADRFKAEDMPGQMARYQPTIITGVPTMYSRMLACEFPEESLRSLRMARCGSAPITAELHEKAEAKLGKPLVVSYGLSEATCTSTMNPPNARRIGSVGTVLRGQEVRLLSRDGTAIDAPDHEGEVCIVGPSLMLGYLDEDSQGRPRAIGDVLRTGDLGRFDRDGYLYITGRIKDVIIRGGENLSPGQIEGVLARVPGVQACCVVGKPDSDLGEVPWAFVVRSADAEGARLSEQQLDHAVTAGLSRIHKPAGYRFVDALPENGVGKIDRRKLAASIA